LTGTFDPLPTAGEEVQSSPEENRKADVREDQITPNRLSALVMP